MAQAVLDAEEYGELLWAAIHDDRRVQDAGRHIRAHWDDLPQHWRDRLNDRRVQAERDVTGTAVLRPRT